MSELNRVLSVYGSVAEMERQKLEAEAEKRWNSLTEDEQEQEMNEWQQRRDREKEEVSALEIEPSETAKQLKKSFDAVVNQATDSYHERQDNYTAAFKDSMKKIADAYGKIISDDLSIYNGLKNEKFGIDYSYSEYGPVTHKTILNLDKKTFLQMYADMYSIGGYKVQPAYQDSKGNLHTVTGLSVGRLRRNEFRRWGVDDPDGKAILDNLSKERAKRASDILVQDNESNEYIHDM